MSIVLMENTAKFLGVIVHPTMNTSFEKKRQAAREITQSQEDLGLGDPACPFGLKIRHLYFYVLTKILTKGTSLSKGKIQLERILHPRMAAASLMP